MRLLPVRVAFGSRQPHGSLVDITPTGQLLQAVPYPFLDADVSGDEYTAPGMGISVFSTLGSKTTGLLASLARGHFALQQ